jgi:hypothetical protein
MYGILAATHNQSINQSALLLRDLTTGTRNFANFEVLEIKMRSGFKHFRHVYIDLNGENISYGKTT